MLIKDIQSNKDLTPAMKQYVELKETHKDALLFFRMGDFYELFFDDAIITAKELNITLTKRGKIGGIGIPMCGIPFHAADNYLPRLIKKGLSVAICEQIVTPDEMKAKGLRGPLKRKVVRVITPGTIIEDHLLEAKSFNFLGCIMIEGLKFSISWVDVSTGVFFTNQFNAVSKNDLSYKLNNLLTKKNFSELLISEKNELTIFFTEQKPIIKKLREELFSYETNIENLSNYYSTKKQIFLSTFSKLQIISSGVLIYYLGQTFFSNVPNLQELQLEKNNIYMEIDDISLRSLEIVKTTNGEYKGSLLETIDETSTAAGARLLKQRIISPSSDKIEIEARQSLAENFAKSKHNIISLKSLLKKFEDVERALTRITCVNSKPKDLLSIANSLIIASYIKEEINKKKMLYTKSNNLLKDLEFDKTILHEILNALKEDSINFHQGNFIKKGYSKVLDGLINLKNNSSEKILYLQNKYSKLTSINSLKIKFNKVLGYHIEVRSGHLEKFNLFDEFIHRQTTAQASRYTTKELLTLEKDIIECDSKILNQEQKIYEKLRQGILKLRSEILKVTKVISKIDIALMTADQFYNRKYKKPLIFNDNKFKIQEGRHPVIEVMSEFVSHDFNPNDCELNANNIWLITGPNMAGKSTFLRQNALLAIMAQSGLFIPVKNAEIGIVDKIFSRVGASDNLTKGQSTFMVEMIETASILDRATENSLIIFDEIGRGTSTFDGLAIAWAVLEYLLKTIRARVLFATHYHELTSLNKHYKGIKNYKMHIKEWENKIIFLYKVVKGSADKSYGVEVAKLAGFPESLINRAFEILEKLENKDNAYLKNKQNYNKYFKKHMNDKLKKLLNAIDPDELTPIEALKLIYKLKSEIRKDNNS